MVKGYDDSEGDSHKKNKKALGKGLDLVFSEREEESLGLVDDRTLSDDVEEMGSGKGLVEDVIKDPENLHIDWTKERNVPINELVIKNKKKKKK